LLKIYSDNNGCFDFESKFITLTVPPDSIIINNKQNFDLISQASENQILAINNELNQSIQLKVFTLSGALILEEMITDQFTPIPFNQHTGIFIYEFIDLETGQSYSGKFNY
jgi:hypothetical protein